MLLKLYRHLRYEKSKTLKFKRIMYERIECTPILLQKMTKHCSQLALFKGENDTVSSHRYGCKRQDFEHEIGHGVTT